MALGRGRSHDAGLPVTPDRSARFARAALDRPPRDRAELYWTARLAFVSGRDQVPAFDAVFGAVVDGLLDPADERGADGAAADRRAPRDPPRRPPAALGDRAAPAAAGGTAPGQATGEGEGEEREAAGRHRRERRRPARRHRLRRPRARRARAPRRAAAQPRRRDARRAAARAAPLARRGERLDVRATLRAAQRTGGDPVGHETPAPPPSRGRSSRCSTSPARWSPTRGRTCSSSRAPRAAPRAEAFVFATRLTRVTRALRAGRPQRRSTAPRAARRTGRAARRSARRSARSTTVRPPRHGARRGRRDALRRVGARRPGARRRGRWSGCAGWPTASCGSTRAWRPRASAPVAGGMAAALPHVDELLSGHTALALDDVVEAIGRTR